MISVSIGRIIEVAIAAWFLALLAAVGWQIVTGRLHLAGMLANRRGHGLSVHRVQMVAITLAFAVGYLLEAMATGGPGRSMPDISTPMLAALIGSHAIYLGGKALS